MYAHLLHLCSTLCNPMDCSPLGSSVHRILQARILEWVGMPSFRGYSRPRDRTHVSCIGRRTLYHWATWEPSFRLLAFNAATRKAASHFSSPCFCRHSLSLNTLRTTSNWKGFISNIPFNFDNCLISGMLCLGWNIFHIVLLRVFFT